MADWLHFTEESVRTCSDGVPSAPLNSTPMPQAFLSPDRMTAFSRPSRFGMTFAPLTDDLGEAVLTWCLEASLARTSPTQAREQDSQALAQDSGPRWHASFATWDQRTSSWRTSQLSHAEDSTSFSGTWPRWGSMLNGACSERVTPALHIAETESGSWPTPTAGDAKSSGSRNTPTSKAHSGLSLTDAVRMDGGVGRSTRNWATPTARDWRSGKASEETHAKNSRPLSEQVGGSLNPTWVEWLMGWPLGWTDLEPLAMDRFQQWLHLHGRY